MIHQIENLLNEDDIVESLKVHLDLQTALATRTGLAIAGPTMVANFSEWLKEESSATWYRDTIPAVRPNSLSDLHLATEAADYHHLGERSLAAVLGARCHKVVAQVAKRAEISEIAAHGLLAITTWALIVGISGENTGTTRKETAYVLASQRQQLVDLGWGPWFDLVAGMTRAHPQADFSKSAVATTYSSIESGPTPVTSIPRVSTPSISTPMRPLGHPRDQVPTGIDDSWRPPKRIGLYVVGVVVALLAVTLLSGAFSSETQLFLNLLRLGPEVAQ